MLRVVPSLNSCKYTFILYSSEEVEKNDRRECLTANEDIRKSLTRYSATLKIMYTLQVFLNLLLLVLIAYRYFDMR